MQAEMKSDNFWVLLHLSGLGYLAYLKLYSVLSKFDQCPSQVFKSLKHLTAQLRVSALWFSHEEASRQYFNTFDTLTDVKGPYVILP